MKYTKQTLKEKLLAAGMSADAVDARLETVSEAALKEMDDMPEAQVLKEFLPEGKEDTEGDSSEGEQVMVLDPSVMKEIRTVVADEFQKALGNLEIELDDTTVTKETSAIQETLGRIEAMLKELLPAAKKEGAGDQQPSRNGAKLRVMRLKASDASTSDEEDGEEDMPMNEEDMPKKKGKKVCKEGDGTVIMGADGYQAGSMTEFVTGN